MQLRFTTKFDAVEPLLGLAHHGRTRVRFSVNAREAERHEGGAPRMTRRLGALRAMAEAGYKVGLTVAPILRFSGWREGYERLFEDVAAAFEGVRGVDLTIELITHRFTPKSKAVLTRWYPGSSLEMDEERRSRKTTKFGSAKYVYPRNEMAEMQGAIEGAIGRTLPSSTVLYWT